MTEEDQHHTWCGREDEHEHTARAMFEEMIRDRDPLNVTEQRHADQLATGWRQALAEFAPASVEEAFALGVLWSSSRTADTVADVIVRGGGPQMTWAALRYSHFTATDAGRLVFEAADQEGALAALEEALDDE